MTFLELCQRLALETRDLGGPPKTLEDGSQRTYKLACGIREAWLQIQLMRQDWTWIADQPDPQTLTGNDDTPDRIAEPYHMAIVWFAANTDGYRQAAPELIATAEREWWRYYGMLTQKYVAPFGFAGAVL